jgi:hypothetical protein
VPWPCHWSQVDLDRGIESHGERTVDCEGVDTVMRMTTGSVGRYVAWVPNAKRGTRETLAVEDFPSPRPKPGETLVTARRGGELP